MSSPVAGGKPRREREEERMASNPYNDPATKVHTIRATGAVYLYGPEIAIVDTPEFQRLGGIKQLGTSYFVFRGAVHTRFEHSLGALQQAQNIINAVNGNPHAERHIDAGAQRLARLGALLHDLPHVPFGHTLEDEFGLLTRHDENRTRISALLQRSGIGGILRDAVSQDEYEQLLVVLDAVEPSKDERELSKEERLVSRLGERAFVADIVANTVCADVLDYIVRDLTACGMPVSIGNRFLDFSSSRRRTCQCPRTAAGWRSGSTSAACQGPTWSPRSSSCSPTAMSSPSGSSSTTPRTPPR